MIPGTKIPRTMIPGTTIPGTSTKTPRTGASGGRRRKLLLAAVACASGLLAGGPSFAGVSILNTVPMSGATVLSEPHDISLEFTGPINQESAKLAVRDPAGKPVAVGPVAAGTRRNSVTVPISAPLRAGTFEITWSVKAADNSTSQGSFSFTYAP